MDATTATTNAKVVLTKYILEKVSADVIFLYQWVGGSGNLYMPCRCEACSANYDCVHLDAAWLLYWFENRTEGVNKANKERMKERVREYVASLG